MADLLDVITFDDIADAAWVTTGKQALIESWLTGVSQTLDVLVGPIVDRNIVAHLNGGVVKARLKYWPVSTVTSVTEYRGATPISLTEEHAGDIAGERFVIEGARIIRRVNGTDTCFANGRKNVIVDYVAGRFARTEDVEERYRMAATIILANLARREVAGGGQKFGAPADVVQVHGATFGVPRAVFELLAEELQNGPL